MPLLIATSAFSERESCSTCGYLALKPNSHCCLLISNIFSPVIILPSSLGALQFISFSSQLLSLNVSGN